MKKHFKTILVIVLGMFLLVGCGSKNNEVSETKKKVCCTNYGGSWSDGKCYKDTNYKVEITDCN